MKRDYDAGYRAGKVAMAAELVNSMRHFADYNEVEFGADAGRLLREFANMLDALIDAGNLL